MGKKLNFPNSHFFRIKKAHKFLHPYPPNSQPKYPKPKNQNKKKTLNQISFQFELRGKKTEILELELPDGRGTVEGLNGPGETGGGDGEIRIGDGDVVDQTVFEEPVGVFRGDHFWRRSGERKAGEKKNRIFLFFFFSPARREWDFPGNQTGGRKREGICVRSFDEEENWWAADVVMVTPPE